MVIACHFKLLTDTLFIRLYAGNHEYIVLSTLVNVVLRQAKFSLTGQWMFFHLSSCPIMKFPMFPFVRPGLLLGDDK